MAVPAAEAHWTPPVGRDLWVVLAALFLGTALSALDATIVSTALPTITGRLGGFDLFAWVGTSYILCSTISTPILGKLGDLYGRRRLVLIAIWLFLLGSLLCGISGTMHELIAARAVQGLGGGGIQALTFGILADLVSPRERGRYMGYYTAIYAASAVAGPLLGGWMVDSFAWQWIFLVNVPIGLAAIAAIMRTLHIPQVKRRASIDVMGALLLAIALGAVVLALEVRKTHGPVGALTLLSGIALAGFLVWETKAAEPIIPLGLFRSRTFACAAALGAIAGSLAFGVNQFLPLQFQDANFVKPTVAGLYLVPIMVGVTVGSTVGGNYIARHGRYRIIPLLTLAGTLVGYALLSRMTAHTPYWMLVLPMLAVGTGAGATFTATSTAGQNAVEMRVLGVATATMVSLRSLGGSIALAAYGSLFTGTVNDRLSSTLPAGTLAPGKGPSSLIRDPQKIRALPIAVRDLVVSAITHATGSVLLWAVPLVGVGLVIAALMPELPLRTTPGATVSTAPVE